MNCVEQLLNKLYITRHIYCYIVEVHHLSKDGPRHGTIQGLFSIKDPFRNQCSIKDTGELRINSGLPGFRRVFEESMNYD